ncbi:putative Glycosyl transferase group 1 [Candidatus Sulfobium mesophilum]|uniref:Putative Glycosyl transferase group 1 n=1 Tax=Candidatus Sulfobium mesophilum TaxID=2016548 RepID=A0A2U3QDN6_9BACT|nr:putative Glycosyl transferase group 1 [Candidatus Sulfobium mesophilum]
MPRQIYVNREGTAIVSDTPESDVTAVRRIKVLHLISSRGVYGAERVVLTLCKYADSERFEQIIGIFRKKKVSGDQLGREAERLGIPVEEILYSTAFDPRQILGLIGIVRRHRPDLIHTHEYKANILGFCLAKIFGLPIVTTVHALHKLRGRAKRELQFSVGLLKYFSAVMPVSGDVRDELQALKVPAEKMVTIKNVPPLTEMRPASGVRSFREEVGVPSDRKLIGFLGRLIPAKGCDQLIHAIANIDKKDRNFSLAVAGDGPERESLEALAEKLGVRDMIHFCGFRSDTEHIYASLDLLVLPSREEGTPLVMLEGMSRGVSVVATKVGGIPDVLKDRVNGLLVPSDDPIALAGAIAESLNKPDETKKRAIEAKRTMAREYDVKTWAKKFEEIYAGIVQ